MRESRAAETRQRILNAAAELFARRGAAGTNLQDITERAHVTTGALYYHFDSKESVALAIIDENWPKFLTLVDRHLDGSSPGLESIIMLTFAIVDRMSEHRALWLAIDLDYRIGQTNDDGRQTFSDRVALFSGRVTGSLSGTQLQTGITAEQASVTICAAFYGLLFTALQSPKMASDWRFDNAINQLARIWPVVLRGTSPQSSLPSYEQFLQRTVTLYATKRKISG